MAHTSDMTTRVLQGKAKMTSLLHNSRCLSMAKPINPEWHRCTWLLEFSNLVA